ncbi:MAG: hypothetical protein ACRET8_05240 [Burkholderiales bacterium]
MLAFSARGLDAVVCGLTPHNLGGPDEHITLQDLEAVGYMHTLRHLIFLLAEPDPKLGLTSAILEAIAAQVP